MENRLGKKLLLYVSMIILSAPAFAEKSGSELMREFEHKQRQVEVANYQLPVQPSASKALVYVVRPGEGGGLVRFNVFIDSQNNSNEVGNTRGGQYIYFSLTPGVHKIYSKAENWAEIQLSVNAGDVVFIKQEVNVGMLMARNSLSTLDEIDGKYYVKHLSKGQMLNNEIGGAQATAPAVEVDSPVNTTPPSSANTTNDLSSKNTGAPAPQNTDVEIESKLRQLHSLWTDGLLTDEEYKAKKTQLLNRF